MHTVCDDVPEHVIVKLPPGPTSNDVLSQETAIGHSWYGSSVQQAAYRPSVLQICPTGQNHVVAITRYSAQAFFINGEHETNRHQAVICIRTQSKLRGPRSEANLELV